MSCQASQEVFRAQGGADSTFSHLNPVGLNCSLECGPCLTPKSLCCSDLFLVVTFLPTLHPQTHSGSGSLSHVLCSLTVGPNQLPSDCFCGPCPSDQIGGRVAQARRSWHCAVCPVQVGSSAGDQEGQGSPAPPPFTGSRLRLELLRGSIT